MDETLSPRDPPLLSQGPKAPKRSDPPPKVPPERVEPSEALSGNRITEAFFLEGSVGDGGADSVLHDDGCH